MRPMLQVTQLRFPGFRGFFRRLRLVFGQNCACCSCSHGDFRRNC